MVEYGFQLGIPAGEGVTHNGEVGLWGEVFFCITFMKDDSLITKEVGHWGIHSLVRACDLEPQLFKHGSDGAHARSCNAEEVKVFKVSTIQHRYHYSDGAEKVGSREKTLKSQDQICPLSGFFDISIGKVSNRRGCG
jgi:hypothetical protein